MPKSAEREAPAGVEQQVGRLDVAVDDAGVVGGVERGAGLAQPAQGDGRRGDLARRTRSRSATVPPGSSSMTMKDLPSCSPTS